MAGGPANEWQNAEMDDCISKPFKVQTLITCFETWLSKETLEQRGSTSAQGVADENPIEDGHDEVNDISESDIAIINSDFLDAIVEIDPVNAIEMFVRIFGLYETHAPEAFTKLEQSVKNGKSLSIAEAAHALKSLSSSIGAGRVTRACDKMEEQARSDELSNSSNQVEKIGVELGLAINEISVLKRNNFK